MGNEKRGVLIFLFLFLFSLSSACFAQDMNQTEVNIFSNYLKSQLSSIDITSYKDVEEIYGDIEHFSNMLYSVTGMFYIYGDKSSAEQYLNLNEQLYETMDRPSMVRLIRSYKDNLDTPFYAHYTKSIGQKDKSIRLSDLTDSELIFAETRPGTLVIDELIFNFLNGSHVQIALVTEQDPGDIYARIDGVDSDESMIIIKSPPESDLIYYYYGDFNLVKAKEISSGNWILGPFYPHVDSYDYVFDLLFNYNHVLIKNIQYVYDDYTVLKEKDLYLAPPLTDFYLLSAKSYENNLIHADDIRKLDEELVRFEISLEKKRLKNVMNDILIYAALACLVFFLVFNIIGVKFRHRRKNYFYLLVGIALPFYIFIAVRWTFGLVDSAAQTTDYVAFISFVLIMTLVFASLGYYTGNHVARLDKLKKRKNELEAILKTQNIQKINKIITFIGYSGNGLSKEEKIRMILRLPGKEFAAVVEYTEENILGHKIRFRE